MRFLPVSTNAMLVELADLDATLMLFDALERAPVEGIEEIVPAARTLMIRFRPEIVTAEAVARHLAGLDLTHVSRGHGQLIEIPVRYDGEDLPEVAELLGITPEEVIRRHTGAEYTVAFAGFAPGFAYMVAPGADLEVPRRKTPRTRIPAGAVGLAGPFSGIYPRESPGGWQIIGTTPLAMFDLGRERPALLQPGDRVRFFDLTRAPDHVTVKPEPPPKPASAAGGQLGLRVLAVGAPVLFQDLGRAGLAHQGVSASGALDRSALEAANRLVGNPRDAACLEITLGGFSFVAERAAVIALTGAPAPITIRTAEDRVIAAPPNRVVRLEAGDTVSVGVPSQGMRSYLAVRGGFAVTPVLGSAAMDTLSGLGPPPVAAGDRLALNPAPEAVAESKPPAPRWLPSATDVVTLDVAMGPRTDWFTPDAVRAFAVQEWVVTPQSSRVGIRLEGKQPIARAIESELPSEGTVPGALQVPPSGQPVLFLADHPLTGGYPVIATVAPYHLDLAAQIPIGARIRFNPIRPFKEISLSDPASPE